MSKEGSRAERWGECTVQHDGTRVISMIRGGIAGIHVKSATGKPQEGVRAACAASAEK